MTSTFDNHQKTDQKTEPNDLSGSLGHGNSDAQIIESSTAKRSVSLWNTVNLFLGIMIGSGIFVSAQDVAKNLPNSGSVISMWLFIGFYSLLGSISFAELGTCIPDSGGDFLYLKCLSHKKISDLVAFLRIFIELVVIRPGTHAIFGLTVGEYLIVPLLPMQDATSNLANFTCSSNNNTLADHFYSCTELTEKGGLSNCITEDMSSQSNFNFTCSPAGTDPKLADYTYTCNEPITKAGLSNCNHAGVTVENCVNYNLDSSYVCDENTGSGSSPNILSAKIFCAVVLNLFFTYINAFQTKLTQQLSAFLSIGKVVILSSMVLLGLYQIIFKEVSEALIWGNGPEQLWDGARWQGFSTACILAAVVKASYAGQWAYAGWSDINYCMGEIANPSKNYPRAAMITLPVVTILYTGIIICFYSVMTHTEFKCGIKATASIFAERALGLDSPNYWVRVFIGLSVSMATAGVLHSSIFAGSRLFSAGVKFNHMPKVIGGIHKEHKTPVPSIFLLCLMSCIYCFTPLVTEDAIESLVNATCFIYFLAIAICIILLVIWRYNGRPNVGSVLDKIPIENGTETNGIDNFNHTQLESTRIGENETCIPLKGQKFQSYKQEKTLDEVFILPIWVHLVYSILSLGISAYNIYAEWSTTLLGLSMILVGIPIYYVFIYSPGPLLEYLGCKLDDESREE